MFVPFDRFGVPYVGLDDTSNIRYWVFMTDFVHWIELADKGINQWIQQHGCTLLGMTIGFPDPETRTMFLLAWG